MSQQATDLYKAKYKSQHSSNSFGPLFGEIVDATHSKAKQNKNRLEPIKIMLWRIRIIQIEGIMPLADWEKQYSTTRRSNIIGVRINRERMPNKTTDYAEQREWRVSE